MKIPITTSALLLAAWLTSSVSAAEPPRGPSSESLVPTLTERDARLGWWREARFGMFVHWGGNQLMNIGPMGNGKIDDADVVILKGIGAWWKINGESIRSTTRTPLVVQAWGESTRKGNRLYLHVFDWPADGKLVVGGLKTDVAQCHLLSSPGKPLAVGRTGLDLTITVPQSAPDSADSAVVLECASEPVADATRQLSKRVPLDTLRAFDGVRQGSAVKETLGTVTLEPGSHEIRVSAKDITGEELFRLRHVTLRPVQS